MPKYIDTHCHLNFQAFANDVDDVVRRALEKEIHIVNVGADAKSSERAAKIAAKYATGVRAAIGLHPVHLQDSEFTEEGKKIKMRAEVYNEEYYRRLAHAYKVVAIGEIGLDYHYLPTAESDIQSAKKLQAEVLRRQLTLARELDLPAIIHCREAHDDLLVLLRSLGKKPKGVLHCFSGDWDLAWQYFEMGFLISFTGLVTFTQNWDELLRKVPLGKIMIETDAPFMAPVPYRGQRNEPAYVVEVAKKIAALKGISVEAVAEATTDNAKHLFQL